MPKTPKAAARRERYQFYILDAHCETPRTYEYGETRAPTRTKFQALAFYDTNSSLTPAAYIFAKAPGLRQHPWRLKYADFRNAVLILDTDTPIDVLDPARYLKSPNLFTWFQYEDFSLAKIADAGRRVPATAAATATATAIPAAPIPAVAMEGFLAIQLTVAHKYLDWWSTDSVRRTCKFWNGMMPRPFCPLFTWTWRTMCDFPVTTWQENWDDLFAFDTTHREHEHWVMGVAGDDFYDRAIDLHPSNRLWILTDPHAVAMAARAVEEHVSAQLLSAPLHLRSFQKTSCTAVDCGLLASASASASFPNPLLSVAIARVIFGYGRYESAAEAEADDVLRQVAPTPDLVAFAMRMAIIVFGKGAQAFLRDGGFASARLRKPINVDPHLHSHSHLHSHLHSHSYLHLFRCVYEQFVEFDTDTDDWKPTGTGNLS